MLASKHYKALLSSLAKASKALPKLDAESAAKEDRHLRLKLMELGRQTEKLLWEAERFESKEGISPAEERARLMLALRTDRLKSKQSRAS